MPQGAEHISLWIAFSAGVLSFASPCVLPLIPSYLTYITGLTFGQLQEPHSDRRVRRLVFFHTLMFIFGFSAIFIFFGALAGFLSSSLQSFMREGIYWIQKIGGILIFLFGVHVSGLFHFGLLLGEKRVQLQHKPTGFFGTFLVGVAFAAGWTPCIGPILGSILALVAGSSANVGEGMVFLTAYSAGLGIPFLVAAILFHGFLSFFQRFRNYIRAIEVATGVLLMVVGSMLFFDLFNLLSGFLYRYLPA
ncbi:MAG: cytochrome c biogenesis protein CcdA [Deltaproteobacteria bacterium]|nr:cytochrome c biogenesis protein CcdA [Deltaproteobacteria bacterium]